MKRYIVSSEDFIWTDNYGHVQTLDKSKYLRRGAPYKYIGTDRDEDGNPVDLCRDRNTDEVFAITPGL